MARRQSTTGSEAGQSPPAPPRAAILDPGIIGAVAMLVVWAAGTFFFEAPGWLHLLLTLGVFLLVWRIVALGNPAPTAAGRRE